MGCCNKKNYMLDHLNNIMKDFYFNSIRLDFIISQISEFNRSSKNYHEFWDLTKRLGVHQDLLFQVRFWETAYVSHSDTSLDGLLMIFILLCNGDTQSKLEYLKYYLSVNINKSKENDNKLILHSQDFKSILMVYFLSLSTTPFNTYVMVMNVNDEFSVRTVKEHFSSTVIKDFTDFILKDYVKKNFYINAGKFIENNIELLTSDKEIRKRIYNYKINIKDENDLVNKAFINEVDGKNKKEYSKLIKDKTESSSKRELLGKTKKN